MLANHAPLMAILEPTELRLYKLRRSDVVRFAQGEGYLQVVDNLALVLVEEAIEPDELEQLRPRGAAETRRAGVSRPRTDSEGARALRDKRRAEAFLRMARNG